ncbi:MAG: GNAT family N-acetyltransferase [Planctomycetes bacterium]|nr:GNAT family N-acetyltransferase [Planctomycetota bacterium]
MAEINTELPGKKVRLRKVKPSDAEAIYHNIKDKAMVKWTSHIPHPYPRSLADQYMRLCQKLWREGTQYTFSVFSQETCELVGLAGLMHVNGKHKNAELGYWVGKKYWNQGFATEAVGLVLQLGFKHLKLERIYAGTYDKNIPSQKVLTSCGFKHEGTMRKAVYRYRNWHDMYNFGILKSECK